MTRRRRRVAAITGTRAEYGPFRSIMAAIRNQSSLQLQTIVTGIHLLREFGRTVDLIARDGWRIDARIRMQTGSDDPLDQAAGLGRGVAGIARFLESAHTDIVLVLGDRIEAMAGALAGVTTGRIVAHVHGGDVAPGDFDDSLRHAITKLAHIHLPATRQAARRIIRLGEHANRVYVVGAPGLDRMRELIAAEPRRRGRSGMALIVQHAYGRSAEVEEQAATVVLDAVRAAGLRRLIIYPNTDRGHSGVLHAIKRHQKKSSPADVELVRSLPRDDYLRALLNADVLIGNSSSGIIEAPLAGTPSVNVGDRQAGRQVGGPSVIHARESLQSVRAALRAALKKRPRRGGRNVYGDGQAGLRIAEILARTPLNDDLLRKRISY
ncbi:MAG: UDP-N-acetylglucosamine 2-epimerase [Planctomycetota bacterium]